MMQCHKYVLHQHIPHKHDCFADHACHDYKNNCKGGLNNGIVGLVELGIAILKSLS